MKWNIDWHNAFVPSVSPLEIVLRGTIIFLALFVMLRVFRRQSGNLALADLLLVVLIADASQNGMAADYHSVTEGLILVGTLVFWSWSLDWLGYRIPAFGRWVFPEPLKLVENGRLNRKHMHRELITYDELMAVLREQGIEKLQDVRIAQLEGDGQISVMKFEGDEHRPSKKKDAVH